MTILKKNVDFFIYFLGGKWRIGQNYREADCWIFSETQRNGIREISANMDWFSNDKKGRTFKAPVRITSISSLSGLGNLSTKNRLRDRFSGVGDARYKNL